VGTTERSSTGSGSTSTSTTASKLKPSSAGAKSTWQTGETQRTGFVGMEGSTKRLFWSEEAARIYGYPPGTEPTPDLIRNDLIRMTSACHDALERASQGEMTLIMSIGC